MLIAPVTDLGLVRDTLRQPSVWDAFTDDGFPEDVEFKDGLYLGAWRGDEYLGLFPIYRVNGATCEAHAALLPNCSGVSARFAMREMIDWIWKNTEFVRLVTSVPTCNKRGIRLAAIAGLTEYGRNPASWKKNGALHDVVLMGVSNG